MEAACVFLANGPSMNVFQTQTRIWGLGVVAHARTACSPLTSVTEICLHEHELLDPVTGIRRTRSP